jgi:hypothetical protein
MIQSHCDKIDQMLAQMNETEKRELLARVASSLVPSVTEAELDAQRRALDELETEMERLPVMNPDDGFTSADHDRILYGKPA